MSLINCPECNNEISDSTKKCPHCGYRIKKIKLPKTEEEMKRMKKKLTITLASAVVGLGMLFCLYFFLSPKTFSWICYHKVQDATCEQPQTCHRCGKTWGNPNGHTWKDATCWDPKTCSVCKATEGSAEGHKWKDATCWEPKTCKKCGATEGSAKGHSYIAATCTSPKTCRDCGKIEGSSLGHKLEDYICTRCHESVVNLSDVPNILDITSMTYEINYVGGIDQYMVFTNKSSKTINYITMKLQFYNRVGDIIKDEISQKDYAVLLFTGPLGAGRSSSRQYWRACFYNSTFGGTCNIMEIEIEYSDGTKLILDDWVADNAVKAWR